VKAFSWKTIALLFCVLMFAELALPAYRGIVSAAGSDRGIFAGIWIAMGVCLALLFRALLREGITSGGIVILLAAGFTTVLMCISPLIEARGERIHILLFGLIGFQVSRDLKHKSPAFRIASALVVSAGTAGLDEILQSFTPGRYGQWKDVLLGAIGGWIGAAASFSLRRNRAS